MMLMLKWMTFLVVAAMTQALSTYIVTMPLYIRPGMEMEVLVNILRAKQPVKVRVDLLRRGVSMNVSAEAMVRQGRPTTITVMLPQNLKQGGYFAKVSGTGGLRFQQLGYVTFSGSSLAVFIQTDKGIYKPGQTVLFRTFAVYPDLKPYTGTFDVTVFDGKRNRIKQFVQVRGEAGVYSGEFTLSEEPVLGSWRIESKAREIKESVQISVEQFVLPKFEVTVDVPPYGLITDTELVGSIEAKYTFGKAVEGTAVIKVTQYKNTRLGQFIRRLYALRRRLGVGIPPCLEPTIEKRVQLNGKATFSVSASELAFLIRGCNDGPEVQAPGQPALGFLLRSTLKVEVNVTESLTGKVQAGEDTIQYTDKEFKLHWLESNAKTFKPGLWYQAFLKVSRIDDTPIPLNGRQMSVTLNVKVTPDRCCIDNSETRRFINGLISLPEIRMIVPANGIIHWSDILPKCSDNAILTASFEGAHDAVTIVQKKKSGSNNFIQAVVLHTSLKAGENAEFEILSTAPMGQVIYQIISRGRIVRTTEINGDNRTRHFEVVPITSDMAPSSKLAIYTVLPDGELLADSVYFPVEGLYKNNVSIELPQVQAEPGDDVSVIVHSDANSLVNLLAVEKSVLLLNSGNDIDRETVGRKMSVFDRGGGGRLAFAFAAASPILRDAGLTVLTDARSIPFRGNCLPIPSIAAGVGVDGTRSAAKSFSNRVLGLNRRYSPNIGPLPRKIPTTPDAMFIQPDRVRKVFPDTWLWANQTAGVDGRAVFTATVPDTITSWVTGAFAMNSVSGLGVAPTNPMLEVFMPFFVSLDLPATVVRGEEVVIQAIVFNFLQQDLSVSVVLSGSDDFQNVQIGANGQEELTSIDKRQVVQVKAGEGASVFFPIVATSLGSIELNVSARSSVAADALIRRLRVEPEGVAQEYNFALLINLSPPVNSFFETRQLSFPPNIVPGSKKVTASVLGDILGSTLNNLDKLLKMPGGCGEQNMINFAPDVFILKYLNATNQLTNDIREKAVRFLERGYQTELSFQRDDGSFSAFGDGDRSGSTWLTAFVLKSFWEAKPFTYIDENVLNRAMDWLVSKQSRNGSFPEVGRVIHKDLQGGSGTGLALTSYVVCALSGKEGLTNDPRQPRRRAAVIRARSYIERAVSEENDIYALSIAAYALKLIDSPFADRAFNRLNRKATVGESGKFWDPVTPSQTVSRWTPPIRRRTQSVEATSYGLLNMAARGLRAEGFLVMKWLVQQQNARGGFVSTQDTVVALQALSEFGQLTHHNNFNVNVVISAATFGQQFSVTQSNGLILQSVDIPGPPDSVTVSAGGVGRVIVQISVSFNVFNDSQTPAFDVRVGLRNETLNGFQLETCATSRLSGESGSGMVVQETGIPTGFQADVSSIGKVRGLKRTESLDRKVVLYFDEVDATPVCVTMKVERVGLVAKSQAVPVRVFQYYSPENQVTVFYQSQLLKDSSICDVCVDCDCRKP